MKMAYIHYLYGKQAGLVHVRQFAEAARKLGAQVEIHAMHPANNQAPGDGGGASSDSWLRRKLKRYLHEPKELLMTLSYAYRELARLRSSPPDVLLVRNSPLNLSAPLVAWRMGLPLVIELNAPPEEPRLYFDQYWHIPSWLSDRLERWKFRRSNHIVVVSSWLQKHLVTKFGLDEEKITISPNGVDIEIFNPGIECDSELPEAFQNATLIGFVGSFFKWHDPDRLGLMISKVAAARPDVRFLLVGDGPGRREVQQRVAAFADRVLFTGWVPHKRVPGLVASMDIGVMPGANHYVSPLKVLEWMAADKAVVAPHYDSMEDLIENGVHGLLFTPHDSDALVRSVLRLVDDDETRKSLGRAAAERARTSLTWEHNAQRVLGAREKAIAQHRSGRTQSS